MPHNYNHNICTKLSGGQAQDSNRRENTQKTKVAPMANDSKTHIPLIISTSVRPSVCCAHIVSHTHTHIDRETNHFELCTEPFWFFYAVHSQFFGDIAIGQQNGKLEQWEFVVLLLRLAYWFLFFCVFVFFFGLFVAYAFAPSNAYIHI